jgi:hypothetical protein
MPPKLNGELYGMDKVDYAESLANRILGVPAPTLDINGETDARATSEGNAAAIGGRANQGEPADIGKGGSPSLDGGT